MNTWREGRGGGVIQFCAAPFVCWRTRSSASWTAAAWLPCHCLAGVCVLFISTENGHIVQKKAVNACPYK